MTTQKVISRETGIEESQYKWGFEFDYESETAPKGLSEDTVRFISQKKNEPEWMLEWRLKAFRHWERLGLEEPTWANVSYPDIDFQDIVYYAAPKSQEDGPKSLDEVDPEILEAFDKLGIPLEEQKKLSGVAIDAVLDSVSVATTYQQMLEDAGVVFCSISEAVQKHPELVRKYLGSVVPYTDNFYATLNSAVFSDGSFCYVPPGVRCPIELMTYFRINALDSGQFERTLIIADKGSYVSYLEGCTAPIRKTHQLHAAVVELVTLDDAEIKYSTLQNWYPGDKEGNGGVFNFVTKRGACRGRNSKISWTQVETGSAITWKYPSVILQGDSSVGEFYSVALVNNYQQADTGTKMIHMGKNTKSTIVAKGISAGRAQNTYRGMVRIMPSASGARKLHAVRQPADRRRVRRAYGPVHRGQEPDSPDGPRGDDVQGQRRPALLPTAAWDRPGRGQLHDYQRLLQGHLQGAPVRVRRRGQPAAAGQLGRGGRVGCERANRTSGSDRRGHFL